MLHADKCPSSADASRLPHDRKTTRSSTGRKHTNYFGKFRNFARTYVLSARLRRAKMRSEANGGVRVRNQARKLTAREAEQFSGVAGITLFLILCLASWSQAQVDRAGLIGTVADPSGRALAQTHVSRCTTTLDFGGRPPRLPAEPTTFRNCRPEFIRSPSATTALKISVSWM